MDGRRQHCKLAAPTVTAIAAAIQAQLPCTTYKHRIKIKLRIAWVSALVISLADAAAPCVAPAAAAVSVVQD
jgi:hypothetical protein